MITLAFADDLTLTRSGIRMTRLHDELWRVTKAEGEVLGYVERFAVHDGLRYRAKRLIPRQRRFIVMGEFWSVDDAIEVFRG